MLFGSACMYSSYVHRACPRPAGSCQQAERSLYLRTEPGGGAGRLGGGGGLLGAPVLAPVAGTTAAAAAEVVIIGAS